MTARQLARLRDADGRVLDPLTDRQREIVAFVVDGWSNAAIGMELFISVETVKSHMKVIMRKQGVSRRTEIRLENR